MQEKQFEWLLDLGRLSPEAGDAPPVEKPKKQQPAPSRADRLRLSNNPIRFAKIRSPAEAIVTLNTRQTSIVPGLPRLVGDHGHAVMFCQLLLGQPRVALTRRDNGSFSTSMNSQASQRKFAAILCVVALAGLLAGQGILRDFVLCLGTDGHVALEPAIGPGGTCETRSALEPDRKLTLQWSPDNRSLGQHCGSCEDLIFARTSPTYSEPSRLQFSFRGASQAGMPLAVVHLPAAHSRSVKLLDRFHHSAPLSSSLISLRSTFLLI